MACVKNICYYRERWCEKIELIINILEYNGSRVVRLFFTKKNPFSIGKMLFIQRVAKRPFVPV